MILRNDNAMYQIHLGDIRRVESVQRHFTERIPGLRDFNYPHRRNVLKLDTLELKRFYCDLIICYKIVLTLSSWNLVISSPSSQLQQPVVILISYRLFGPFAKNSTRKNFYRSDVGQKGRGLRHVTYFYNFVPSLHPWNS